MFTTGTFALSVVRAWWVWRLNEPVPSDNDEAISMLLLHIPVMAATVTV
jgi:hypothetical protein